MYMYMYIRRRNERVLSNRIFGIHCSQNKNTHIEKVFLVYV